MWVIQCLYLHNTVLGIFYPRYSIQWMPKLTCTYLLNSMVCEKYPLIKRDWRHPRVLTLFDFSTFMTNECCHPSLSDKKVKNSLGSICLYGLDSLLQIWMIWKEKWQLNTYTLEDSSSVQQKHKIGPKMYSISIALRTSIIRNCYDTVCCWEKTIMRLRRLTPRLVMSDFL